MSKKLILFVVLVVLGISFAGYKLVVSRSARVSGLKVVSVPAASIFLNEKLIGKTPFEDNQPPGEYVIKLIPDDSTSSVVSWQGKVTLAPSLLTYVKRELGGSELTSAGEILALEKIAGSETQITVSSTPDAASVLIDGQQRGTTPYSAHDILPGEHDVAVSSPGFIQRTVRTQAISGYNVIVNFQLALVNSGVPTSTDSATVTPTGAVISEDQKKKTTQVAVIKDTPTGFLRVRSGPGTGSSEVAQIKPGEKYEILEEKDGWYKIPYETGKEGWISARYVTKQE